jgi:hypothetical protein
MTIAADGAAAITAKPLRMKCRCGVCLVVKSAEVDGQGYLCDYDVNADHWSQQDDFIEPQYQGHLMRRQNECQGGKGALPRRIRCCWRLCAGLAARSYLPRYLSRPEGPAPERRALPPRRLEREARS